jgi:hypothetical protein
MPAGAKRVARGTANYSSARRAAASLPGPDIVHASHRSNLTPQTLAELAMTLRLQVHFQLYGERKAASFHRLGTPYKKPAT